MHAWLHNGNMGIVYFLYIDHTGTVVLPRGKRPQVKNPWGGGGGGYLKFKNQCHFQYDTTKSLSISEVIHNSKLLFYSHFAF